jgi:hypothetical protein
VRTLLIAYELVGTTASSVEHAEILERIKQFPSWVHVQENLWVIRTESTASAVRKALNEYLHSKDRLLIVVLASEGVWRQPLCETDALRAMF